MKRTNLLLIFAAVMVTCYLTANVMAVKIINICGINIFDAGTIIFPLTYMLGETVTELWGARTARRLVYLTFACQLFFTLFVWIATLIPYPEEMESLAASYHDVFCLVPRITLASLTAFLTGELTNVTLMAKIKQWQISHFVSAPMWVRTIGSSIFGYTLDTSIFVMIAFSGVLPVQELMTMIGIQIAVKVGIEVLCSTPLSYAVVAFVRRHSFE